MMKHCVECGAALEIRPLENEGMIPYCPVCAQYRFPIFNTAVSMAVTDEKKGKVLLIQQYGKPSWILVAGYVTRGEQAEHTVIREVKEEVGLTVTRVTFNRSRFFEPSNTLMLNFTAHVSSDEPIVLTGEVDRAQWFTYEEAERMIRPNSLAQEFLVAWLRDREAKAAVHPGADLCTCGDTACPNHPVNHGAGCTPCIAKNLKLGEIPSCFFRAACGHADQGSYFYRDFASAVLENSESCPGTK